MQIQRGSYEICVIWSNRWYTCVFWSHGSHWFGFSIEHRPHWSFHDEQCAFIDWIIKRVGIVRHMRFCCAQSRFVAFKLILLLLPLCTVHTNQPPLPIPRCRRHRLLQIVPAIWVTFFYNFTVASRGFTVCDYISQIIYLCVYHWIDSNTH